MALAVSLFTITVAILCATFIGIMEYARKRRLYKQASKFEGPAVLPFIGNAHLFLGSTEDIITKASELVKTYSSPFRVWLGPRLFIVVTTPEQLRAICLSPKTLDRGDLLDFTRPWWGTGLLTASAEKWRVHRKLIQPTFNQKILNAYVEIFAAQSKILCEQMEQHLDGPEFEITDLLNPCTLDMICETAMGVKIGSQRDRSCLYLKAVLRLEAIICKRMISPWLYPDFIFYHTQLGRDQRKYIKRAHIFTNTILQGKKDEFRSGNQPGTTEIEDSNHNSMRPKKAFLDYLVKLSIDGSTKFSDEELQDEVNSIVMGGYDTTATTNSFVMLILASHPDIQEKVYQELYEIYGDDDIDKSEVTYDDLSRMNYLERVIKETLRLFPFIPFAIRAVMDDLIIDEGITLPKGSTAVMGILDLHRSEKYWPDPLKFEPDRFLPEEIAKRHPYTYMAFGGGPRNCLGLNYAMMAMKTLQATILRRYILKKDNVIPEKDIRLKQEMSLKPVVPVTLRIERRTRK